MMTKIAQKNSVTIIDLVLDAQTLCVAGTKFNSSHNDGPVFATEIMVASDCDEKDDVATLKVVYALNEAE